MLGFYENIRRSNFLYGHNILTEGFLSPSSLVMRESQFDELRGLRQIAVSQAIYAFETALLDNQKFIIH
jgi:hypothetical protein